MLLTRAHSYSWFFQYLDKRGSCEFLLTSQLLQFQVWVFIITPYILHSTVFSILWNVITKSEACRCFVLLSPQKRTDLMNSCSLLFSKNDTRKIVSFPFSLYHILKQIFITVLLQKWLGFSRWNGHHWITRRFRMSYWNTHGVTIHRRPLLQNPTCKYDIHCSLCPHSF